MHNFPHYHKSGIVACFSYLVLLPQMEKKLIDVSHVSAKGKTVRISVPKRVLELLGVNHGDIIAYYLENGSIVIEKVRSD